MDNIYSGLDGEEKELMKELLDEVGLDEDFFNFTPTGENIENENEYHKYDEVKELDYLCRQFKKKGTLVLAKIIFLHCQNNELNYPVAPMARLAQHIEKEFEDGTINNDRKINAKNKKQSDFRFFIRIKELVNSGMNLSQAFNEYEKESDCPWQSISNKYHKIKKLGV